MLSRFFALFLLCTSFSTQAQYPSQTVRVVVGFPPGGTTDVIGRLVAQGLSERLGKPFVVENRPGASGSIGAAGVAKAAPDGHTLLMAPSTQGTNAALYASLPYDTERDFAPVSLIASTPYLYVVHPGLPVSGRVPMMFENVAVMTPHVKKGTLRALAVSSAKRTPLLPEVPTVSETGMGLEGFEVLGWFGLYAPAGTPADIVRRLNAEVNALIVQPATVQRFAELGAEPLGGTPEALSAFLRSEQDKWGKIIRELGIKLQ